MVQGAPTAPVTTRGASSDGAGCAYRTRLHL